MGDNNVIGSGNHVNQVTNSPGATISQNIHYEEQSHYSFKKEFSISIKWIILPLILFLVSAVYIYHSFAKMNFTRMDFHSLTVIVSLHKLSFSIAGVSAILFGLFFTALVKAVFKDAGTFSPFLSFWLDFSSGSLSFGKLTGKCPSNNCDGVLSVVKAEENQQGLKYIGRCNKEKHLHNYTYERRNNSGRRVQLIKKDKERPKRSGNNIFDI